MLNKLKKGLSNRAKVGKWLDHINETNLAIREEVLQACKDDKDAARYFVGRYERDCN